MAEQYLAGHPTTPCSICGKPTPQIAVALCTSCWCLRQYVENHATTLLRSNAAAAPKVRELLIKALETKPEPPEAKGG
jgi:hypothetical protein